MNGRRAKRRRKERTRDLLVDLYVELEHEKVGLLQRAAARQDRIGAAFWQSQRRPPCP